MTMTDRVLAPGQWLGRVNRVRELEFHHRLGWVLRDSTGEWYCQNKPEGEPRLGVIYADGPTGVVCWCPDGLPTADDSAVPVHERVPSRWPDSPAVEANR